MIVFVVAVLARLGYGLVRYSDVLSVSGDQFIALWDYDAIEHVLIARAILTGKGYVVDPAPDLAGKHVRAVGRGALFKAPLYQYLLATVFGLSGFRFTLLLPMQAALGGALSCVVAMIALKAFEDQRASLLAGLGAAVHPILINTASQPYNENVFFLFWVLWVWFFIRWLIAPTSISAIVCGVIAGVSALTRESVLLPFGAAMMFAVVSRWRERRAAAVWGVVIMFASAAAVISPWALHNYVVFGVVVPISSISGTVLGAGNNECVAAQSVLTPFYGDDPCPPLDEKRTMLLGDSPSERRVVLSDRAYARLGLQFVLENPWDYLRLCLRRAWTMFMPYHPRSNLSTGRKILLAMYTVSIVWVGSVVAVVAAVKRVTPVRGLLVVAVAASLAPLAGIFVSHDLRFRIGADLLLACFASQLYSRLIGRV